MQLSDSRLALVKSRCWRLGRPRALAGLLRGRRALTTTVREQTLRRVTYRTKESRPSAQFELRPAPGYWAAAALMTLLGAGVALLFVWGTVSHGQPSLGALVRGVAVLGLVAIFWFATSAYRANGTIVVDDEQVAFVDAAGRKRWSLPVREVSFEIAANVVVLRSGKQVRRLSVRVFGSGAAVDQLSQALMVRALGERAGEMMHGVFAELFSMAPNPDGSRSDAAPSSPAEAELEVRLNAELEKLD